MEQVVVLSVNGQEVLRMRPVLWAFIGSRISLMGFIRENTYDDFASPWIGRPFNAASGRPSQSLKH